MKQAQLQYPFYRWGNWALEKLSNLSKVVQLQLVVRIQTQEELWSPSALLLSYTDFPRITYKYACGHVCVHTHIPAYTTQLVPHTGWDSLVYWISINLPGLFFVVNRSLNEWIYLAPNMCAFNKVVIKHPLWAKHWVDSVEPSSHRFCILVGRRAEYSKGVYNMVIGNDKC